MTTKFKTWTERASEAPSPSKQLFGKYLKEGQLGILAARTGVGKTILAMTIADAIASGKRTVLGCQNETEAQKVLYYDFELNDEQFNERYRGYQGSDNMTFMCSDTLDNDRLTIARIREDVNATQSKVVIVDNITVMLGARTYNPQVIFEIFRDLKVLCSAGLTILVLCHTPKIKPNTPLTEDSIAGSSMAVRLVDSAIFLAESSKGDDTRYIKHVKARSQKEHKIMECQKESNDGFLSFECIGWGTDETEHFGKKDSKEQIIEWKAVFSTDTELTTAQLKERLFCMYEMKDSTARKYYSKYLEPVRKGTGIYRIPQFQLLKVV